MLQNLPDLTFMRSQVLMFPVHSIDRETQRGDSGSAGARSTELSAAKNGSLVGGGTGGIVVVESTSSDLTELKEGIRTISYS